MTRILLSLLLAVASIPSYGQLTLDKTVPYLATSNVANVYVIGGSGTSNTLAYSTDGINYTGLGTSIFSTVCYGIASNGHGFVAVGAGTNSIAYSDDGINWTGLGISIFDIAGRSVCWTGSVFVAVGASNSANTIAYSYDGVTWTGLGMTHWGAWSASGSGESVCYNGSVVVAVGNPATSSYQSICYSYSGTAPTAPNDGDFWQDGTHLYFRNGSTSKDLLASGGGSINNTSWTGTNWTSTTAGESEAKLQEALGNVGSATLASALVVGDNGKPVTAQVANMGIDSYTKLMLHLTEIGGVFLDSSILPHAITNNNGVTSDTSHYVFGTSSAAFIASSSQYLSTVDSSTDFVFTGDFTIEARLRTTAPSSPNTLCGTGYNTGGWMIFFNSGVLHFYYMGNDYNVSWTPVSGTWYALSLTRSGTTVTFRINGTTVGTPGTISGTIGTSGARPLDIGRDIVETSGFTGNIQELRVSNGIARYTADYTPSAIPFAGAVAIYNTSSSKPAQNLGSRTATAPIIAAGTGAGTSPTISIATGGSDSSFQITLTTGSSPAGSNATIGTVTFAGTMPNTPFCHISPANANAAALNGATQVFGTSTTTGMVLTSGTSALTAATAYAWNVHVF